MDNFWISFYGDFAEGYKPDFNISKNKPNFYEGYISAHVYTYDFVENLKAENTRYREALALIVDRYFDLPEDAKMYKGLKESKESLIAREALKGE